MCGGETGRSGGGGGGGGSYTYVCVRHRALVPRVPAPDGPCRATAVCRPRCVPPRPPGRTAAATAAQPPPRSPGPTAARPCPTLLQGVGRRCRLGLLTLFEWYKYVEVRRVGWAGGPAAARMCLRLCVGAVGVRVGGGREKAGRHAWPLPYGDDDDCYRVAAEAADLRRSTGPVG